MAGGRGDPTVEAPRQSPLGGASKQPVRSIKRTLQRRYPSPACQGKSGSRARTTRAKATDGVKILDVQHPGTRRRMEGGTVVQLITEQERSVSAPAIWPQVASLRCPVAAKPISGGPVKWWSAERKSEEGVVAVTGVDNITRRSKGPLGRCAWPTGEGCGGTAVIGYLPSYSLA